MENQVKVQEKTSMKTAFFYSFGEVGSQLSWAMINSYLTIFYTDVVGLTAAAISIIMLVARVWDAINDPMMGMIADRTNTRWGKFRPYLMFAPPFLAVFNVLTFTVFPVEGMAKVLLCLVCYVGAGMAYTAVCITYGALVNRLARDSQVRMNYTSARAIGASVTQFVIGAAAMPLILYFSGSDMPQARGYFITAVICSVVMLPIFWLCAYNCKETVVVEKVEQVEGPKEKRSVLQSLKLMSKNKMLLITVFCVFMGAASTMGRMGLLSYYAIYVVGSAMALPAIFSAMNIFNFVGCLLLPVTTRIFGKRNWLIILNIVQIAAFVIMFLVPANNMVFLVGISCVIGITNSASNVCTGMLSDCIEYGDWKYGIREEGLTYSYMSFGVKLATAVTGSVGVLLLAATGFVPNAEQTEAAKTGINAIVNLLPAVMVFVSMVPLFFYKLNKKTMDMIVAEIDARNAAKKAKEN